MTLQTNQPITSQELADSVRYGVAEQDRILRKKEVAKIFSVASSTLDDWLNPKSKRYKADFPKRIEIGRNSIGFLSSEVNAYLSKLVQASRV
ncbi:helix-turn-helix transcriptional regulator [Frederiksenia canicola]|uniref:AlpA family transcriptional regulator n=1 Tax=Frederiksenia canicola TaxID=123824 RepID=A0ABX9XQJ8_9PAST|nr:AlpA family transcriptional regulator [Frederiksenia canicola]